MVYVSLAARVAVGLVFLIALVNKVRSRAQWTDFVAATRRLAPGRLSRLVPAVALASAVAASEAGVVLLLAAPQTSTWGFALAAGLAGLFSLAIVSALRRGERGSCNCFGASTRPLGAPQLVRNLLLVAAAGSGLASTLAGGAGLELAGAMVALVTGAVVALVLVTADDIVSLFRPMEMNRGAPPSPGGPDMMSG